MKLNKFGRLLLIGGILPILLVALLLAACGSDDAAQATPTSAPPAAAETVATNTVASAQVPTALLLATPSIAGVEVFNGLTSLHKNERITYANNPPAGGDHNPAWMNCGIYTETVPAELAVHSMEHGAVWITYLPDLVAEQVTQLKILTKAGAFRLLSPNPDQSSPVIISAWGYQLRLDDATDPRLAEFIAQYENRKDGPEYGAPCDKAYGEPEK